MTAEADDDDLQHLAEWFSQQDIPLDGVPRLELIKGGRSNLTYRVVDDEGGRYVLRRPPRGHVLESAHDVAREHRVITALAGSRVPVPKSFGLCTDLRVLGAPFYVMNLVPGSVITNDADGATFPLPARTRASRGLMDALAEIHLIDVAAVGLGTLGRKQDYCQRQLRRWQRQFHASTRRDLPLVDKLHDRLVASVPPQRFTGLVHGDYRPGNTLLGDDGSLQAVLDWELATLGDTLADLGWMLGTWREPGEEELFESPTGHEGWLSRQQLLDHYQRRTGRDVSDVGWYIVFALWRLACISEGIYTRYRLGVMGDDGFNVEAQGSLVVRLAEAARDSLDLLN
ncbi:MAG TPA: phosphotransferase family protein [Streptosporangiaceae bacterium]|nr:phosphotransferase family protein [Streptosporangiaceae bacterium]